MSLRLTNFKVRTVHVVRLVFFLGLLLVWQSLCWSKIWPPYLFPAPADVLQSLVLGFEDQSIPIAIASSMWRLCYGYFIALLIGLAVGLLMAQSTWVKNTLGLLVLGLQTLPSVCWLPLALLWFGLNERAILFVVVMGALFPISQATEDGIKNTAPVYVRAARNLGARRWKLYSNVVIPAALPSLASGMKLGWAFAWRSLMAGELLYAVPGLGNLLLMGRELNDMSQVIALIIVIIFIGLVTDIFVFRKLEKRLRERWGFARRR